MALDGRVILTGFRNDVPELLRTMDVVVLTSLWEGLPLTLLEAMAAAKPVVATRVQGTAEVVVHGDTGILVAPEDSAQLAAAVVELVRNPAKRQRMGLQGRARVEREFSVDRMVSATVDVYKSLLAG
jgi:glycosyltransferase involved in cell wall biosynthesis